MSSSTLLPFRCPTAPWPEGFEVPSNNDDNVPILTQWVNEVTGYSSQYGSDGWSAAQVVGPPRVRRHEDNNLAWAPSTIGSSHEWLELKLAQPCQIQRVKIHESLMGGAFLRLKLWDDNLNEYVTAVQRDHGRCGQYPPLIRIEEINVPLAHQIMTNRLKLEFDARGGSNWYEVDAIQVIGTAKPVVHALVEPILQQQPTMISQQIAALRHDKNTSDCTLLVGGDRIPVHRVILAARCPLFKAMVANGELPLGGEKEIDGIEKDLLELVLEWIYTGSVKDLEASNCVALVAASDCFQMDDLTAYGVAVFDSLLTVDNAAMLYAHFDHLNMESLQKAALKYCGKYFLVVSTTSAFQQLEHNQLLAIIEQYKKHTEQGKKQPQHPRRQATEPVPPRRGAGVEEGGAAGLVDETDDGDYEL